jgi:hypothetical protein
MTKKPKKKKSSSEPKANKTLEQQVTQLPSQELPAENPFDFGGLPDRNLKKNLGCG